jgi:hypothetical protein
MSGLAGKCHTPHMRPTIRVAARGVILACKSGRANPRQPVSSVTPPMSRKIEASKASGNDQERMGVLTHSKLPDGTKRKFKPAVASDIARKVKNMSPQVLRPLFHPTVLLQKR